MPSKQDVPKKNQMFLAIIDGEKHIWPKATYQDSINWSNIKSVQFVKDSTQLASYGEEGKNGVIIIKTKKK